MEEKIQFNGLIMKLHDGYAGFCAELNISVSGDSPEQTRERLIEAVRAFLVESKRTGVLGNILEEAGFVHTAGEWAAPMIVANEPMTVRL